MASTGRLGPFVSFPLGHFFVDAKLDDLDAAEEYSGDKKSKKSDELLLTGFHTVLIYTHPSSKPKPQRGTRMNTAEQVKAFYTMPQTEFSAAMIVDYSAFEADCEERAIDTDNDVDAGVKTYEFADGSVIVWCGSDVICYGSRS